MKCSSSPLFSSSLYLIFIPVLILSSCGSEHMPVFNILNDKGSSTGGSAAGEDIPTYNGSVKGLFEAKCKQCHGSGSARNWLDYDQAFAAKDLIFDRVVVKKNMPLGSTLTAQEIDLISRWVKGGALKGDTSDSSNGGSTPNNPPSEPTPPSNPPTDPKPLPPSDPNGGGDQPTPKPPIDGSKLSWSKDIQPLLENRCALCHNADSDIPNWLEYSVVFENKDKIFERVVVLKDMPAGTEMDQYDRDVLEAWIKSGANQEPKPPIDATKLTWSKDILPLLENRCALCHNADSDIPNWLEYSVVFENKDKILERVVVLKDMPAGTEMDQYDRDVLEAWIKAGSKKGE